MTFSRENESLLNNQTEFPKFNNMIIRQSSFAQPILQLSNYPISYLSNQLIIQLHNHLFTRQVRSHSDRRQAGLQDCTWLH